MFTSLSHTPASEISQLIQFFGKYQLSKLPRRHESSESRAQRDRHLAMEVAQLAPVAFGDLRAFSATAEDAHSARYPETVLAALQAINAPPASEYWDIVQVYRDYQHLLANSASLQLVFRMLSEYPNINDAQMTPAVDRELRLAMHCYRLLPASEPRRRLSELRRLFQAFPQADDHALLRALKAKLVDNFDCVVQLCKSTTITHARQRRL